MSTTAVDTLLLTSKAGMNPILSPPHEVEPISVTISRNRPALGKLMNHLYLRLDSGMYVPFAIADLQSAVTNTTNATSTVPNPTKFKVGDKCSFWDSSADVYSTEFKTITGIVNSTGVITFSGVWTTAPTATEDYLLVADNILEVEDAVLVLEDVDFSQSPDLMVAGIYAARCKRSLVNGRTVGSETLFIESKNAHLLMSPG